jgi:hypothetical protein
MSRRLIASLSTVVAALLVAATIALASGDDSSPAPASAAVPAAVPAATVAPATAGAKPIWPGARAHGPFGRRGHGGAMLGMFRGVLLKSAADRLGVTPAKLEAAVRAVAEAQLAKKAAAANLTAAESAALKGCRTAFGPRAGGQAKGTCDRAAAMSALKKLKALPKPDLAALKTELSDALAAELGLTGAKVLEAARAELSDRLDQGVKLGFLTADGKAKALACFDTPASCDPKALKGSLLKGAHGRFGGPGKHGFGARRHGMRQGGKLRGGRHS